MEQKFGIRFKNAFSGIFNFTVGILFGSLAGSLIPEKGDKLNFPRDAKVLNDTLLLRTLLLPIIFVGHIFVTRNQEIQTKVKKWSI